MKNVQISVDPEEPPPEVVSPLAREPSTIIDAPSGVGSRECGTLCSDSNSPLIYALGQIDYTVPSRSRRDSIDQSMPEAKHPEDPKDLLAHLAEHPANATAIQWTLNIDATPVYVIEPRGAFAKDAYDLLTEFLREQLEEGVERASIPGVVVGTTPLRSGVVLPV